MLYCPHQDDLERLLGEFVADVCNKKEIAGKMSLRLGVFANAQREPDVEERFRRAQSAAYDAKDDARKVCGCYDDVTGLLTP